MLIIIGVFSCKNDLMNVLESPEISIILDSREVEKADEFRLGDLRLGESQTYSLKIKNKGQKASLKLTGTTPVLLTGTHPDMFSVSGLENLEEIVIGPGESLELTLEFSPVGSLGEKQIQMVIETNDSDEESFTFTVIGTAVISTSDSDAPAVALTSEIYPATNNAPIPVSATFTEEVVGFTKEMITVTGGYADNLTTADNINFTFDITNPSQGSVTAYIASGQVNDIYANGNTESNLLSIIYDTGTPTVTLVPDNGSPTNVHPVPVTIAFSEEVTGFEISDITITNGTLVSGSFDDSANPVFRVDVETGGTAAEVVLDIPAEAASDAAGNLSAALSSPVTVIYDDTAPSVEIATSVGTHTNVNPVPVTFTFSEEMTGFESSDVNLSSGTLLDFNTEDNVLYTANILNPDEDDVTVYVASSVAQDLSGRGNLSSNALTFIYDKTNPSVIIESDEGIYLGDEPVSLTITFSEEVDDGFDTSDISVDFVDEGAGSIIDFYSADNITYTAKIDMDGSGPWTTNINVDIAPGAGTDLAGNPSTAAGQLVIHFNSNTPTVTISTGSTFTREIADVELVDGNAPEDGSEEFVTEAVTEITITFSQEIFGFIQSYISKEGDATIDGFTAVTPNLVWTFDVTLTEDPESVYFWIGGGQVETLGVPVAYNKKSDLCMITRDSTNPTGTMETDNGNAYTNYTTVDLAFTTDGTGTEPYQMMISNAFDFSGAAWETYSAAKEGWVIDSGVWDIGTNPEDTARTIYWKVRDQAGNESVDYSDTITQTPDGYFDISYFGDALFQ